MFCLSSCLSVSSVVTSILDFCFFISAFDLGSIFDQGDQKGTLGRKGLIRQDNNFLLFFLFETFIKSSSSWTYSIFVGLKQFETQSKSLLCES